MNTTVNHVLVATDLSEASTAAVAYAAALARGVGARLHLVYVLEEPFITSGPYNWHLPDTPARRDQRYRSALQRLSVEAAAVSDVVTATVEVRTGEVGPSIAQAAVDYGADLIVIGTRGHAALRHLFAGDFADRLQRLTHCPILIVREGAGSSAPPDPTAGREHGREAPTPTAY